MKSIALEEQQPVQAVGYTKHILLEAEDLQCEGARVQIVTILPGDRVADHFHQEAREFYYVLQGRCRLTVNGTSRILQPGDMLLMEPGDVHRLTNLDAIPFRVLVFKTHADDDTHWAS